MITAAAVSLTLKLKSPFAASDPDQFRQKPATDRCHYHPVWVATTFLTPPEPESKLLAFLIAWCVLE